MDIKYAVKSIIKHKKSEHLLSIYKVPKQGFKIAPSQEHYYECVELKSNNHWVIPQSELEGDKFLLEQDSFLSKKYSSLTDIKQ